MNPSDRSETAGHRSWNPTDRSRLVADVSKAASVAAPSWPLTTFVAVNPLGAFTDRPFDDAVSEGRRWFGADGYLPIASYRSMHDDGQIDDADLDTAVMACDPLFAVPWTVEMGGRDVDVIDVVRHDLLHGPAGTCEPGGPLGSPEVDRIVTMWCASYVDDDVAWAMPDRDLGFYRAWRSVARHDRALRSLSERSAKRLVAELPDDPIVAIHRALEHLAVDPERRVEQLRAWLLRTPGWASFARWCDDWAPADHPGIQLHAVDLIAVRASIETIVHRDLRSHPPVAAAPVDDDHVSLRVAALVDAFGMPTGAAHSDLHGVVATLTDQRRQAVFQTALETHTRDAILRTIDSSAPASDRTADAVIDDRVDAQVVCCIDVRSEGLRRNLEALGSYETFGFAGFFGVPVRWRTLGADAGQARCPVLVTPQHEIVEQALDPESDGFLQRQAIRLGLDEARHSAKTGLGSPFALAESLGWVSGPRAALRTLLPAKRPDSDRPTRTRALVERELAHDARSGLSLADRTLFAEAIIATIGFRRFAPLVVLCGHGAATVNNPHASSLDCGACGGAPGGASARIAAEILNDPAVRAELRARTIDVPDTTRFVAAEHDTVSDAVEFFDAERLPAQWADGLDRLRLDLATAGAANAAQRATRLPGAPSRVRNRGGDWAEVRQEWGLAGNAAFVIGPRSITAGADLGGRAFLHSYDAELDTEGKALETIMTAPLVVGQWISSQYHFSSTAPDVFGAGDKMLHNPVGGIGVLVGQSGDLAVGLPEQSVSIGDELVHKPVRLHTLIQAPLDRIETIVQRNAGLRDLVENQWIRLVARSGPDERWSVRESGGTWVTWWPSAAPAAETVPVRDAPLRSAMVAS